MRMFSYGKIKAEMFFLTRGELEATSLDSILNK